MSDILLEILLIVLLVIANGVFALAEIAIVSARKVRLQQRANEGDAGAQVALELIEEPTRFLSTVQIGITLVGILAGAFGGATIAEQLAARLSLIPGLAPYSEAIGIIIVVLGITYLSLVIGELAPKRLALSNPERIAAVVAAPMRLLSGLAAPVVHLLSASTDLLLRVLGIRAVKEPPVTQEEIKLLIDQGTRVGVFVPAEQEMVEGVLRLGERRVSTLMTSRTNIVWLDLEEPLEKIRDVILNSPHAYFPVARGILDDVVGILRGRDLLARQVTGQPVELPVLLQPPVYVPDSRQALEVLELFKQSGQHMVLVIDEFGGLQGMVTLTDMLEALVGDIPSPGQSKEPHVVRREDGSWLLDGRLTVDEFAKLLGLSNRLDEASAGYETLGGFVMARLGRIPAAGQHFEFAHLRFEVVDMDGMRVDKVLVSAALPKENSDTP